MCDSFLSLAKELQVEEHSRTYRRRHQRRERDNSGLEQGVLRGQSLDAERRKVHQRRQYEITEIVPVYLFPDFGFGSREVSEFGEGKNENQGGKDYIVQTSCSSGEPKRQPNVAGSSKGTGCGVQ